MLNLGLGGVTQTDVDAAAARYRARFNGAYVQFGRWSQFARAQDVSAIFPDFISRLIYGASILEDDMVHASVEYLLATAAVRYEDGRLAGIKNISTSAGRFYPTAYFYASGLNPPGHYQNGGHWPLYTIVALALAYSITQSSHSINE